MTDTEEELPEGVRIVQNEISWSVDEESIPWSDINLQELPEGIEQKVLHTDERSGRIDKVIKFPVGYVEPRHTHEAEHSTMILRGRMLLYGRELTTGDYLFGPSEIPHGPMRYPDGCVVFSSSIGGSIKHEWDERDVE